MKLSIYIIAILLCIASCQNSTNKEAKQEQIVNKKPTERVIPKNTPKMTITSGDSEQSVKIFSDENAIKQQQELVSKDNHIGNLNLVLDRRMNGAESQRLTLNKLNVAALDTRSNRYGIKSLNSKISKNDSGDEYIKLDNGTFSLDLDPESGTYENFKIAKKGIGVVSTKGFEIKIGDKINGIEKYFPKQYENSTTIKLRDGNVESTRISLTEFIDQKSDVYLYVHRKDGVITEIGTWEQY